MNTLDLELVPISVLNDEFFQSYVTGDLDISLLFKSEDNARKFINMMMESCLFVKVTFTQQITFVYWYVVFTTHLCFCVLAMWKTLIRTHGASATRSERVHSRSG